MGATRVWKFLRSNRLSNWNFQKDSWFLKFKISHLHPRTELPCDSLVPVWLPCHQRLGMQWARWHLEHGSVPGKDGHFENDLWVREGEGLMWCLSVTVSARWGGIREPFLRNHNIYSVPAFSSYFPPTQNHHFGLPRGGRGSKALLWLVRLSVFWGSKWLGLKSQKKKRLSSAPSGTSLLWGSGHWRVHLLEKERVSGDKTRREKHQLLAQNPLSL